MEPNKNIENQFKEALNSREILPSAAAWDRLDAMLTAVETKKPTRKNSWFLIAAGFVGIVIAGIVFFQINNKELSIKNEVAISKKRTIFKKANANIQNENQITAIGVSIPTKKSTSNNQIIKLKKSIINQKTKNQNNENQNQIAQVTPNHTEINVQISSENPESLLNAAEISKSNPEIVNSIHVNPNSLLSQVDGELNEEFRETKFQKLKRNFKAVKVAMESRNNK